MIFLIGLILGAIVLMFVLQNIIPVTVAFLTWEFQGSLAVVLLLAVLAGMVISVLLSIPERVRKEAKLMHLKKHNKKLEEDLETHKNLLNETRNKLEEPTPTVVAEKVTIIESHPQL